MRTRARSSRSRRTEPSRVPLRALAALASAGTIAVACSSPDSPRGRARAPAIAPAPRSSAMEHHPRYRLSDVIVFRGACDASGAAGLPGGLVAVADDEDNRLRVYDANRGGDPVDTVEAIRYPAGARGDDDEMDLEGAATVGTRVYWIASHGRKKSGKRAPSRLILFATDISEDGRTGALTFAGQPYPHLLRELVRTPSLARYDLASAADRSPISPGGLNIEGLTDTPDGHLLLGFRNPVPAGRALLVPITNPAEMVGHGAAPRFGAPVELNLEGRGIRTIASLDGAYWIVGGDIADPVLPSRLYRWNGATQPVWIDSVDLRDLNIEAIATVTTEAGPRLLLLSDDGSRDMGGRRCKKLRNPAAKRFRGVWLEAAP